jgi:hypothetical protein
VSSLESAVEAAVRAAYEGWVDPTDAPPDPPRRLQLVPEDGSLPGPTRRRRVITWADILGAAEAAADIGPQVRAELARIERVSPTSTAHR